MTDNITPFPGLTVGEVPVDNVLDGAKEKDLDRVIVIGFKQEEGEELGEYYFASSGGKSSVHLWDMEQFKSFLLREYS